MSEGGGSNHPRTVSSERLREDVLTLRKRGLVPLAIADVLDVGDQTVWRYLRSLVATGELEPLPKYLTQDGPDHQPSTCPHCGEAL